MAALFRKSNHEVIILKRSFSNILRIKDLIEECVLYDLDRVAITDIFKIHSIDIIMHCATDYGRKNSDSFQIVEANLLLPLKLLEFGRKNKVKAFINTDTILDKGVNTYSLSKGQFKEWLLALSSDMVCCNIALEHFYGPGDDPTKFVSYVISELNKKVVSIDLTLGYQERDFIHVDDVKEAMYSVASQSMKLEPGFYEFEIGTGNPISIRHFVEMIKELSGNTITELKFGAIPYRENEIMKCVSDTRAITALGWTSKKSLVQGLKEVIQYEKEQIKL